MFNLPIVATSEFIQTFDASLDLDLWMTLVDEETKELEEALAEGDKEHILKESADVLYVMAPAFVLSTFMEEVGYLSEDKILKLIEKLQKAEQALVKVKDIFTAETVELAVDRVHKSNMSKLGDDGKPIRREDGKIMKGPNYKAPDLKDLI